MLSRMDRLLGDEALGVFQQLSRQVGSVVAHRVHEQTFAIGKGQR